MHLQWCHVQAAGSCAHASVLVHRQSKEDACEGPEDNVLRNTSRLFAPKVPGIVQSF